MEGVWRQGFRPLVAAQKPTNRASYQKREPRAEPNGNPDDRYGPIWQMSMVSSPVTLTGAHLAHDLVTVLLTTAGVPRLPREWAHRELVALRPILNPTDS